RQTRFEGQIHLKASDFYQLLFPVGFLLTVFPAMFRQASVVLIPLFLGFLYGMVQLHFDHYRGEIRRLLTDLMTKAEGTEVTAPMMGTFYRAVAPGQLPLVNVGDRVEVGQAIGMVAAANLTNELQAKFAGEVVKILVADGEAVEFGQPLMRIRED
ncbi:MAG: biotin/lipoyl-containing protein, partial [Cyanobacteria bacterium P01_H01_bin.58]